MDIYFVSLMYVLGEKSYTTLYEMAHESHNIT